MNILIVGCGRVGRRLVHVLERLGHDVSVLDEDAANLALLKNWSLPIFRPGRGGRAHRRRCTAQCGH